MFWLRNVSSDYKFKIKKCRTVKLSLEQRIKTDKHKTPMHVAPWIFANSTPHATSTQIKN